MVTVFLPLSRAGLKYRYRSCFHCLSSWGMPYYFLKSSRAATSLPLVRASSTMRLFTTGRFSVYRIMGSTVGSGGRGRAISTHLSQRADVVLGWLYLLGRAVFRPRLHQRPALLE